MIFSVRQLSDIPEQTLVDAFWQTDDWRKEQILQLKMPLAKKQSLLGDHLARELLAKMAPGRRVQFARDQHGKPYLLGGGLHFNISHSGDYVLCAADEAPVGADIEAFRTVSSGLIHKVCSAQELEWIAGSRKRFLQVWTAKEAYLKYLGIGLTKPLQEVNVVMHNELRIDGPELFSELTEQYAMSIVYEKRHP